ncbi:HMW glutenin [Parasponia andersonii]|uniref:HMW glutenin n=1 Tax=Parasponia andersonii TaxID=3476 RepID=A0A2P5DUV6_PARAD|nr:HMW glutenin [Parasponia andersonii]
MDSSKLSALLLICMLFISSATPILGCPYCEKGGKPSPSPSPKHRKPKYSRPPPSSPKGPITVPPIHLPPVTLPPIKPPVKVPPVTVPVPPVTVPPISVKPPVTVPAPPVTVPPVTPIISPVTPIISPPPPSTPSPTPAKPCPPTPASEETCPIDTLKLGACVELLGGLVHIGLGDPVANECCPVLQGLVALEAAVCLCTTLKLKVLNLSVYVPLAVQLLITCGKTPPPGFTCTL